MSSKTPLSAPFERLASVADVPNPGVLGVQKSTGERICLIRHAESVTAVADCCTHQEFALSMGEVLPDGTIQCAWHGAKFDCRTGAVRQAPAVEPLAMYDVRLSGDEIWVGGPLGAGAR